MTLFNITRYMASRGRILNYELERFRKKQSLADVNEEKSARKSVLRYR